MSLDFIFSKILPLCVLPLGFCLFLLILGLVVRSRMPVFISVLLLWFFSLGFVSQGLWRLLESPWQRRAATSARTADAIVVLSGGIHPVPGPAQLSEWHDPDRFHAGLNLFFAGKAPRLLFTGGTNPFTPGQRPECHLYLHEAVLRGIPSSSMDCTPPVTNTSEEAIAIRALMPANKYRVLLVTSAFHMRRSQRLFERQGLHVIPFPVDFKARGRWAGALIQDPTQWLPSASALHDSSRALRELLGRFIYRSW